MNYHQNQMKLLNSNQMAKLYHGRNYSSWFSIRVCVSFPFLEVSQPYRSSLKDTIGTFLIVDDHQHPVSINDEVELVIRRIYAQDGWIRYGLKAIPLKE